MATKRLTDTGIANLSLVPGTRREIWDTIVPGLAIRVGARRKTFVAIVRARGRVRRVTLGVHAGLGVSDARTKARHLIEQGQNGIDPVEVREAKARQDEEQRRSTVASAVTQFVALYAQRRQRSWRISQRRLEMYLVDLMGERPVSSITRADIVRAIDVVQAKGFAIGANRTLANFKTFFRWCVERGLLERSPAELVRAPSIEVSRDRILSDEEIRAIWKATLTYAGPYGRIVRLLLLTAQRREEVAGMRWDEVDLKSRAWTLCANRTKSGRLHVVPLSEAAMFGVCSVPRVGPLLFGSQADPRGDRAFSCWNQAKLRLDRACGVSGWRLHDLRRTAATGMARLGVSPTVIERVLNHAISSAGPLAAVYQRYDYAKEKREALQLWSGEVLRLTSR